MCKRVDCGDHEVQRLKLCLSERGVGRGRERKRDLLQNTGPAKKETSLLRSTRQTICEDLRCFLPSVMDRRGTSRLSGCWAGPATGHPSVMTLRTIAGALKVSFLLVVAMSFKGESCGYALKVANTAARRPTGATAAAGRAITSTPSSAYVNLPFCRRRCFYCDFPIKVGETAIWIADSVIA